MGPIAALVLSRRQGPVIVVCIVAVALLTGAYLYGYQSGKRSATERYERILAERDQAALKELTEAVIRERKAAEAAAAVEREHIEEELKRAQEQKVVTKVVKEYVRSRPGLERCAVDTDGLRLWNAANSGGNTRTKARRSKRP